MKQYIAHSKQTQTGRDTRLYISGQFSSTFQVYHFNRNYLNKEEKQDQKNMDFFFKNILNKQYQTDSGVLMLSIITGDLYCMY